MKKNALRVASMVLMLSFVGIARADLASKLEKFVGYTIVQSNTIDFSVEDGKKEDGFSGCSHGRRIVFTDGTSLTCSTYGYQYAYRPTAIILAKPLGNHGGRTIYEVKMVVGDDVYDMRSF